MAIAEKRVEILNIQSKGSWTRSIRAAVIVTAVVGGIGATNVMAGTKGGNNPPHSTGDSGGDLIPVLLHGFGVL